MKKKIIIYVISSIIVIIIGYILMNTTDLGKFTKQVSNMVDGKDIIDEEKEPEKKVSKFNKIGNSKQFNVKVMNVESIDKVKANFPYDDIIADGKFIEINLQLNNIKEKNTNYETNSELIINDVVYKLDENSINASSMLNENELNYKKNKEYIYAGGTLYPGEPKLSYIVFDIPKDIDIKGAILVFDEGKFNLN